MNTLLPSDRKLRTAAAYGAMLAVTAALYQWIRHTGADLRPSPAAPVPEGPVQLGHSSILAQVLLALALITLVARLFGGAFRRYLGQPPVIGEIVAGLMLGPSLLGAIAPEAYAFLLPAAVAPFLGVIAKIGVVLFMFLVGLEIDPKLLRSSTHATLAISHASIVVPFLLGASLALVLYPLYSTSNVSFTVFSLFVGISLSVTAFPVLARILTDRGMQRTSLGTTALACAAVDDVTAWTLLAVVAGIATAQLSGAAWTILWVVLYVAVMLAIARPLLRRSLARAEGSERPLSRSALAAVFAALLLSAFVTEAIGIHALFGAFLLGVVLPHDGRVADQFRRSLGDVVIVLFLPAFFAITGMRTEVGLLAEPRDWLLCTVIVIVAVIGKFGGTLIAARFVGLRWRDASALGILMNTRGLMELIVLNLGLDLGVITQKVFTMMVIMALVTTFMAAPVLNRLLGRVDCAEAEAEPSPTL